MSVMDCSVLKCFIRGTQKCCLSQALLKKGFFVRGGFLILSGLSASSLKKNPPLPIEMKRGFGKGTFFKMASMKPGEVFQVSGVLKEMFELKRFSHFPLLFIEDVGSPAAFLLFRGKDDHAFD